MNSFKELELRQTENALARWRSAALPGRPRVGWVKSIRQALSMSARALGERVGVTDAAVRKFEAAEAADTITLASLRKLAQALDCELQYALVPRQPLDEQLRARAKESARALLAPVAHTMALEDQKVTAQEHAAQIAALADELHRGDRRKLW